MMSHDNISHAGKMSCSQRILGSYTSSTVNKKVVCKAKYNK